MPRTQRPALPMRAGIYSRPQREAQVLGIETGGMRQPRSLLMHEADTKPGRRTGKIDVAAAVAIT